MEGLYQVEVKGKISDEEESIKVGTIKPGVDIGTDDPDLTGLVAASVVLPPMLRLPPS